MWDWCRIGNWKEKWTCYSEVKWPPTYEILIKSADHIWMGKLLLAISPKTWSLIFSNKEQSYQADEKLLTSINGTLSNNLYLKLIYLYHCNYELIQYRRVMYVWLTQWYMSDYEYYTEIFILITSLHNCYDMKWQLCYLALVHLKGKNFPIMIVNEIHKSNSIKFLHGTRNSKLFLVIFLATFPFSEFPPWFWPKKEKESKINLWYCHSAIKGCHLFQ